MIAGLQRRRDDEVAARAVPALQEVRIVPEKPVRTSAVESFSPTPEWIAIRQRVLARGVEHPLVRFIGLVLGLVLGLGRGRAM